MTATTSASHLFAEVLSHVRAVCEALGAEGALPTGIDLSRVVVEPPRDPTHGDIATNASDPAGNRDRITAGIGKILEAGAVPVVLGGDDSVPIPVLQAYEGRPLCVDGTSMADLQV